MSSWSGGTSFANVPSWDSSFNTSLPSSLTSSTSGGFGTMLPAIGAIAGAGASLFGGIMGNRTQSQIAQAQINASRDAAIAANIWNEAFRQDRSREFVAENQQQDIQNRLNYKLGVGQLQLGEAGLRSGDYANQLRYALGQDELTGNLGSDIAGRTAAFGWGADLEQGRRFKERERELGSWANKETAISSERSKRERLARISPETQKAQRFEEELNRRRIAAGQLAGPTGMFGPTSFSSRVFG